jgi:hypothetical protein
LDIYCIWFEYIPGAVLGAAFPSRSFRVACLPFVGHLGGDQAAPGFG